MKHLKIASFLITVVFSSLHAQAARQVYQCESLSGLIAEAPPKIVADAGGLYVETSMIEHLHIVTAPDLYESPSFSLKFLGGWGLAQGALLTLKSTGETVPCR